MPLVEGSAVLFEHGHFAHDCSVLVLGDLDAPVGEDDSVYD